MKDFGHWYAGQGSVGLGPDEPMTTLADELEAMGLDLLKDGRVFGNCCICGARICLTDYVAKEDIAATVDPEKQYCGRDPRCCP